MYRKLDAEGKRELWKRAWKRPAEDEDIGRKEERKERRKERNAQGSKASHPNRIGIEYQNLLHGNTSASSERSADLFLRLHLFKWCSLSPFRSFVRFSREMTSCIGSIKSMTRRIRAVKCCGEDTGKHRECIRVYQANSFEMVPPTPCEECSRRSHVLAVHIPRDRKQKPR